MEKPGNRGGGGAERAEKDGRTEGMIEGRRELEEMGKPRKRWGGLRSGGMVEPRKRWEYKES
jgi:hypothetical protein